MESDAVTVDAVTVKEQLQRSWCLFKKRHNYRLLAVTCYRNWLPLRMSSVGSVTGVATDLQNKNAVEQVKLLLPGKKRGSFKVSKNTLKKDAAQRKKILDAITKYEKKTDQLHRVLAEIPEGVLNNPALRDLERRLGGYSVADRSMTGEELAEGEASDALAFFDAIHHAELELKVEFCRFLLSLDGLNDVSLNDTSLLSTVDLEKAAKLVRRKSNPADLHKLAVDLDEEKEQIIQLLKTELREAEVTDDPTEFELDSVSVTCDMTTSDEGASDDSEGWEGLQGSSGTESGNEVMYTSA